MLPCLNKRLFGIDCFGCGMQRSLLHILRGDFEAAFQLFPAIYPLLILLSFVGISFFIKVKYAFAIKIVLLALAVITMIVSYFIRMKFIFN